jgi:PHD/YefM family antitoxin component YafN of YafNO toxin-antitoxin module
MFFVALWILLLGVPVLVYLGLPIFWSQQRRSPEMDAVEAHMQALFLEREQSYSALVDLDEDYEAGKLSREDYQALRGQLLQETAAVLAQIETSGMASVEAEIEKYKQAKQSQS